MCLTKELYQREDVGIYNGISYKAVERYNRDPADTARSIFVSGVTFKEGTEYIDTNDTPLQYENTHEKYPCGYHSFIYLEDAIDYAAGFDFKNFEVYKCSYSTLLAKGIQGGKLAIVTKEIKLLKRMWKGYED